MPDASISLGLDAREMYRDLQDAVGRFNNGMDRIGIGANRAAGAHDGLFKSQSRVAGQMSHIFRTAMAGGDSMSVLAASIEAVAHSMKIGFGFIAGGYIAGMGISKIAEITGEYSKLNDELDKLTKPRHIELLTTKEVEKHEQESEKIIEKAQAATGPDEGFWHKAGRWVGDIWKSTFNSKTFFSPVGGDGAPVLADKPPVNQKKQIIDKTKLAQEERKRDEDELERRKTAAEAEKRQESKKESMQLTLEELAKEGREWAPGNDTRAGAGRKAREALKEMALSRKSMLAEHWDEALMHRDKADAIKNGIGTLKDSQKDMADAVQRGNDSSAVLRQIATNTGRSLERKK